MAAGQIEEGRSSDTSEIQNVPNGPATPPSTSADMDAEGRDAGIGGTSSGSTFGGASGVTSTGGSQVGGISSGY
jgi:hypothetical protein